MLGIAKDAPQKAIKDAFRNLAMTYHPDRNKSPDAESRFKEIAEAYAVLSDPAKRAQYDARGFSGVEGFSQEDLFGGINFEDIFGGLNFDFGNPFESFFHHKGPVRGANIETELFISLDRVVSGGEEELHLRRPAACPSCHGSGASGGAKPLTCETCKGTGRITTSRRQDADHLLIQQISTCPACHGHGSIIKDPCAQCHGSGQVEHEESLTVKIPQGIEEGMALRIPGRGMPGAGGVAGDLFVIVCSKPDTRFERAGADLLRRETIALTDAVLGTKLQVPTMNGSVSVTVPAGTQPGSVLRLKGRGLPEFDSGRTGELYLRIEVHIPEKLSVQERELYQKLRVLGGKPESASHWWQGA